MEDRRPRPRIGRAKVCAGHCSHAFIALSCAMPTAPASIRRGQRVRIIQRIPRGSGTWTTSVEGEVLSFHQAKTGSWFAHARDDRLWLDRVELRRDDGEVVVCSLDRLSRVEVLRETPEKAVGAGKGDRGDDQT